MSSNTKKEGIYTPKHFAMALGRMASTQYLTGLTVPYTTLFLTTMVGIPAAILGTINTINTVIGLILIPVVAMLLQRVKLPWGKFRSWMYICAVVSAIFIVLLFTDLGLENGMAKYILYGAFLVCMHSTYNPASSAGYGLFADMTTSSDERADASAVQVQCSNIYKVAMSAVMVPLITFFAGVTGSEKMGYTCYAIVAAVVICLMFVIFANAGRAYDPSDKDLKNGVVSKANPVAKKSNEKVPLPELLGSLFTAGPISLLGSKLLRDMANFCISGMVAFYYTYVAQDLSMMAIYLSISAIVCMAGAFACPVFNRLMGAKKTYLLGTAMHGGAVLLAYFLGQNAVIFTVLLCIVQFGYGMAGALETGLYADAVDYTILKRGSGNTRPFMMTMLTLPGKFSSMFSPAVLSFGLAVIGFDKTNVTPEAAEGIRMLLSGMPGILLVAAFVLMLLFPVTKEKLEALRAEKAAK